MPNTSVLLLQYTNYGKFDRAYIDDKRITRTEFTELTGIDTYEISHKTWEYRMKNWKQNKYEVKFLERDVS